MTEEPIVVARDERAKVEEREGVLKFVVLTFSPEDPTITENLAAFCDVISAQLPDMDRHYILRIVYDHRSHRSLVAIKNGNVIGGICFRTFSDQRFIEIVFAAVSSRVKMKGYGTRIMSHLKEAMKREGIREFLTFADNTAIPYFRKNGFSKKITLPQDAWVGRIKSYEHGTLMQCSIHPAVPSYLDVPSLIRSQRDALYALLPPSLQENRVVHPGIQAFAEGRRFDPEEIPGIGDKAAALPRREQTVQRSLQVELRDLLNRIKRHKSAWPFQKPVDVAEVPGYTDVVKDPIDLSLIDRRLGCGTYYLTREIFVSDILRMLENCRKFNPPGNEYHEAAVQLEAAFAEQLSTGNRHSRE